MADDLFHADGQTDTYDSRSSQLGFNRDMINLLVRGGSPRGICGGRIGPRDSFRSENFSFTVSGRSGNAPYSYAAVLCSAAWC